MNTSTLTTRDGLQLHWHEWRIDHPRGTVLLVHGHGEHIGRYEHVARYLNQQGWAVAGYDQRGHGRSPGRRGHIAQPDDLLHDLAAAIDQTRARLPGGPLIVLAHSMGGVTAARFALGQQGLESGDWARAVDGYVLSSPALDVAPSAAQKLLLAFGLRFMPWLSASNGLKSAWVSRDPAEVAKYDADPLVHGLIAPKLAQFIIDSGERALAHAAEWHVPTLLLYGGSDRCVNPAGSDRFAATAPKKWVSAHAYPVLYHEIFNEPERDEVLTEVGAWLDRTFNGTAHLTRRA
ncbi:lysophospholipase [Aquabacterium sp.]|uniref:alpha/beta hydrolase n=1 Tax=Aquabacterium sp. TaxID=1872578 RepID=UPI0035B4D088